MKQLEPQCVCGRPMRFPRRRKQARCPSCGVKWEQDKSGYWAVGLRTISFTPRKPNHYEKIYALARITKGKKGRAAKKIKKERLKSRNQITSVLF